MPNWCSNSLVIKHKDPSMIERVLKGREGLLMEFVPTPAALTETMAGSYGDTEKQRALEAKEQDNLAKYGYKNWYDWNVANWGTKWDVNLEFCERIDTNTVQASFESAWSPPTTAYERLLELGFEIEAMYYEPGMAFAGIWDNGHDDYYEYGSMNAEEISKALPKELDEEFGISESVAEWESEQEE